MKKSQLIRTAALLVALLMAVSLWGCSLPGSAVDAKKIAEHFKLFKTAMDALQGADAIAFNSDIAVNLTSGSDLFDFKTNVQAKITDATKPVFGAEFLVRAQVFGTDVDSKTWVKDGFSYTETSEQKIKTPITEGEMKEQKSNVFLDFTESVIKTSTADEVAGGTRLTFTIDGKAATKYLLGNLAMLATFLGKAMKADIQEAEVSVLISPDGSMKDFDVKFDFSIDLLGNPTSLHFVALVKDIQLGGIAIEYPADLDSYTELQNGAMDDILGGMSLEDILGGMSLDDLLGDLNLDGILGEDETGTEEDAPDSGNAPQESGEGGTQEGDSAVPANAA
jgi:hypothetical protein